MYLVWISIQDTAATPDEDHVLQVAVMTSPIFKIHFLRPIMTFNYHTPEVSTVDYS